MSSKNKHTTVFAIRPFHMSDMPSLYDICLKTGDGGKDASSIYRDIHILGHFYAAPYALFEPDLCYIVTMDGTPSGYILGTRDSESFYQRCESEWFTRLREQYSLPENDDNSTDARIIRLIYEGHKPRASLAAYPAHLHIDLLPSTQGRGQGRKLMQAFLNRLADLTVPAVHIEVGNKNEAAIAFYKRLGFHEVIVFEYSIVLGMTIDTK